jgi:hypothetical protein
MDIAIKLTIEQWNQVLDIMSDASIRRAMPLVNEIVRQAKEQMPETQTPVYMNGGTLESPPVSIAPVETPRKPRH